MHFIDNSRKSKRETRVERLEYYKPFVLKWYVIRHNGMLVMYEQLK